MSQLARKNHSGSEINSKRIVAIEELNSVRAHIEIAFETGQNGLAIIGWLFDCESQVSGLSVLTPDPVGFRKKRTFHQRVLEHESGNVQYLKTQRPDVTQALSTTNQAQDDQHGFVLFVSDYPVDGQLALALHDGRFVTVPFIPVTSTGQIISLLKSCWPHSGAKMLFALKKVLSSDNPMLQMISSMEDQSLYNPSVAVIDQAFLFNNQTLILNGWTSIRKGELVKIELLLDHCDVDITSRTKRYFRPDLLKSYPWSSEEALGLLFIINDPAYSSQNVEMRVTTINGECQLIKPNIEPVGWSELSEFISSHDALADTLFDLLDYTLNQKEATSGPPNHLPLLRKASFAARHARLPTFVEFPEKVIASIDKAYPLGEAGVLIFGWQFSPVRKPVSVSLYNEDGRQFDVGELMTPIVRGDVFNNYKTEYPQMNENCGFVCFVPISSRPGDLRGMRFDFGEIGDVWLKVPTEKPVATGLALIKEMLGMVAEPNRIRHELYNLFNSGLGRAVGVVNQTRQPLPTDIESRQFGSPSTSADVSIVVPLYGRFDFMRHQLAHFADDSDFNSVDLIYVVDDPSILDETLELAAKYHPLFDVPFRVLWYGHNRGFAGANNVGVGQARAEHVLLMNSDVIPSHKGWVSTLKSSLDTLAEAGAVGPLLQFYDDSIQHAGMYPKEDPLLPEYVLNTHKQMGMSWSGNDEPSEHPMLTAACLMLRKKDYQDAGGLDEGYLIGDFEDSDLCMSLRKQGMRLWLEPKAKLWHLERQSQNLGSAVDQRQMITLYNGWRYAEKIRSGVIADPTQGEV